MNLAMRREALLALTDVFRDVADEIQGQPDFERSYVGKRVAEVLLSAAESAKLRTPAEVPGDIERQETPAPAKVLVTGTVHFDWTQLRLITQMKVNADGRPIAHIGKSIGFANLDAFLLGTRPTVTVENTIRILLWLGVTDYRQFVIVD